tara:strand:- start:8015 stop:8266 length:252 start_codon:yes stop_codon:yes gene_type:complete
VNNRKRGNRRIRRSWIGEFNEKALVEAFDQTISRVIRKFEYEKQGLVVDYIGIENRWHPFRGHVFLNIDHPVVSLRSTTGYWL